MTEIILRVTYRVRAHQISQFEEILTKEILPLASEHGLTPTGIWKTLVGEVGEYMELWTFDSLASFGEKWPRLLEDARVQEIFKRSGPMVQDEKFALLTEIGP